MKQISTQKITETVRRLCIEANISLPDDIRCALDNAFEAEKGSTARGVIADIIENYSRAEKLEMPICKPNGPVAGYTQREDMKQIIKDLTSIVPDPETRIMNAIADTHKYGMWDRLRLPPRDLESSDGNND